jgi:hypothetical protein
VTRSTVGTYAAIINGTRYQYVSTEYTESFSDVSVGLYNAIIQGDPSGVTVTYNQQNELIEIISNNANKFILNTFPAQRVFIIARMYLQDPIATGDIQEDLSNIYAARSFYALASTDRTVSNVLQCAQFALSNKLLFGTASSDPNIYSLSAGADSSSIAALLNISGGDRSFVMYHQDAGNDEVGSYSDTYPEMAWFGRMLNTLPGAQNWALKRLAAIAPTSGLSTTQIQNIFNKNCNIFYRISGVAITRWGTLSSGAYLYIDVLRGADWLVSSIQESVYGALIEAGKIPYTDKGIEVIASTILQQLRIAEENGYLSSSPTPTVSVPNAIDIPPAEKEARVLNNVTFTATLAGAINTVNIAGTLTF